MKQTRIFQNVRTHRYVRPMNVDSVSDKIRPHSFVVAIMAFVMLFVATAFLSNAKAQVTIGDLREPQDFSVLELISNNTMGLRLPQMTTEQRNNMQATFGAEAAGKAMGLLIFNTTTHCVETWDGVEWIQQCAPPPASVTITVGATDAQDIVLIGDNNGDNVINSREKGDGFSIAGTWRGSNFGYLDWGNSHIVVTVTKKGSTETYYSDPSVAGGSTNATLTMNANGTWELTYPSNASIDDGIYAVSAEINLMDNQNKTATATSDTEIFRVKTLVYSTCNMNFDGGGSTAGQTIEIYDAERVAGVSLSGTWSFNEDARDGVVSITYEMGLYDIIAGWQNFNNEYTYTENPDGTFIFTLLPGITALRNTANDYGGYIFGRGAHIEDEFGNRVDWSCYMDIWIDVH